MDWVNKFLCVKGDRILLPEMRMWRKLHPAVAFYFDHVSTNTFTTEPGSLKKKGRPAPDSLYLNNKPFALGLDAGQIAD